MVVANLPGNPTIPEFPPSTYDGSDLYSKASLLTVTGSGAVATGTASSTSSSATRTTSSSTRTTSTPTSFCATRTVTVYRWRPSPT